MMSTPLSGIASNDTPQTPARTGWLPWWRRAGPAPESATTATSHETPARVAQHEAERRRRLAATASLPLTPTLAKASNALFQSVVEIDEIAAQMQARSGESGATAALSAVQERMNDALQHCDQLSTLVRHLQHLLEPAALAPKRVDLANLLSLASYSARAFMPDGLMVVNRVGTLPPVLGDRAELQQALIDCLVQIGRCVSPPGQLEFNGGSDRSFVWLELCASCAADRARPGMALESAIETLARHRGALDIAPLRGQSLTLRIRLPAGR